VVNRAKNLEPGGAVLWRISGGIGWRLWAHTYGQQQLLRAGQRLSGWGQRWPGGGRDDKCGDQAKDDDMAASGDASGSKNLMRTAEGHVTMAARPGGGTAWLFCLSRSDGTGWGNEQERTNRS
jgi:hypothetical protein